LERSSKTDQGFEPDGESVSPNKDLAEEMRIDPLRTKRNAKLMTACAESGEREDLPATASDDDDAPHVACSALGKLRLPRSLLEKWVEEPFFEKAVVGCFVRLGVGKAPGARGEPQYKVMKYKVC